MYQRVLGGSNRTFFVAIPFSEWSEIDGWMPVPEILTKAYGETEAAELLQASGEMLDSLSIGISQTVPEFSSGLNPPSGVRPSFAQVIRGGPRNSDRLLRWIPTSEWRDRNHAETEKIPR